jgi:hypothetical protein
MIILVVSYEHNTGTSSSIEGIIFDRLNDYQL